MELKMESQRKWEEKKQRSQTSTGEMCANLTDTFRCDFSYSVSSSLFWFHFLYIILKLQHPNESGGKTEGELKCYAIAGKPKHLVK